MFAVDYIRDFCESKGRWSALRKNIFRSLDNKRERLRYPPKPFPSYWARSLSIVCLMTVSLETCSRPWRPLMLLASTICSNSSSNRCRYLSKRAHFGISCYIDSQSRSCGPLSQGICRYPQVKLNLFEDLSANYLHMVPDRLARVFQNQLISWDFHITHRMVRKTKENV